MPMLVATSEIKYIDSRTAAAINLWNKYHSSIQQQSKEPSIKVILHNKESDQAWKWCEPIEEETNQ